MKFDSKSQVFTVDGALIEDAGTYNIGLKLGYKEYHDAQVRCMTQITVKYIPKFNGITIEPQSLACKYPWSLKVPIYADTFKKTVLVNVDLGETK